MTTVWILFNMAMITFSLLFAVMVEHLYLLMVILELVSFSTIIILYLRPATESNGGLIAVIYLIISSILAICGFYALSILYRFDATLTLSAIKDLLDTVALHGSNIYSTEESYQITVALSILLPVFFFKMAVAPLAI